MEEFGPILVLLVIWLCIGLPIARTRKREAEMKAARKRDAFRQSAEQESPAPAPARTPAPQSPPEPRLRPTVAVTQHDDSVYRGSLNAVTGEGYDPCHDEDLGGLDAAKQSDAMMPVSDVHALPFGWTGSDIVRGIVVSEILNRKQPVRR